MLGICEYCANSIRKDLEMGNIIKLKIVYATNSQEEFAKSRGDLWSTICNNPKISREEDQCYTRFRCNCIHSGIITDCFLYTKVYKIDILDENNGDKVVVSMTNFWVNNRERRMILSSKFDCKKVAT